MAVHKQGRTGSNITRLSSSHCRPARPLACSNSNQLKTHIGLPALREEPDSHKPDFRKLMKNSYGPLTARVLLAIPLVISSIVLLAISTLYGGNRAAHRLHQTAAAPAVTVPVAFSGTYDPHEFP